MFLQLMETYSLSHTLSLPDALIAATALVHNIEIYTLNTKDFGFIPNLSILDLLFNLGPNSKNYLENLSLGTWQKR